jgi:hypothetical protein
MNKKAILASLFVAASSTAALADPYIVQGQATVEATVAPAPAATVTVAAPTPTVIVRDHRDGDDENRGQDVDGQFMRDHRRLPVWSVVSSADRLSNGRAVIGLNSWKSYSRLKLEATKGSFDISRVKITFKGGASTVLKTDGDLTPGSAPLTINLDGSRQIRSITVFGSSSRRAQFEILAA